MGAAYNAGNSNQQPPGRKLPGAAQLPGGCLMAEIVASVPDELAAALDATVAALQSSRAAVVRQALEQYLEDFDDLAVASERLRDDADPALDWVAVRRELRDTD